MKSDVLFFECLNSVMFLSFSLSLAWTWSVGYFLDLFLLVWCESRSSLHQNGLLKGIFRLIPRGGKPSYKLPI